MRILVPSRPSHLHKKPIYIPSYKLHGSWLICMCIWFSNYIAAACCPISFRPNKSLFDQSGTLYDTHCSASRRLLKDMFYSSCIVLEVCFRTWLSATFGHRILCCRRQFHLAEITVCCSEGGFFNAILSFPKDYPNSPPTCRFTSDMWHPNGEWRLSPLLLQSSVVLRSASDLNIRHLKNLKMTFDIFSRLGTCVICNLWSTVNHFDFCKSLLNCAQSCLNLRRVWFLFSHSETILMHMRFSASDKKSHAHPSVKLQKVVNFNELKSFAVYD